MEQSFIKLFSDFEVYILIISLIVKRINIVDIINHKRLDVTIYISLFFLLMSSILRVSFEDKLSELYVFYIFLLLYFLSGLISEFIGFPWENKCIYSMNNMMKNLEYDEIYKKYPFCEFKLSKPFFIQSNKATIEWKYIYSKFLILYNKEIESYEILQNLLKHNLLNDEEVDIKIEYIYCLILIGDYNRAKSIFDIIAEVNTKKINYFYFIIKAKLYEINFDFGSLVKCLHFALDIFENNNSIGLAWILNEIGRVEFLRGNRTNSANYYYRALQVALKFNDKRLLYVVYRNLIDIYIFEKKYQEAGEYLIDFEKIINKNNIIELFLLDEYKIEIYRQVKNDERCINELIVGRRAIQEKLDDEELLFFDVSELKIRWNSGYRIDE
jgi:hypothetical protein